MPICPFFDISKKVLFNDYSCIQLFFFTIFVPEMLQNIIQCFAENHYSLSIYIKYTLADITLLWPFKLGNTTLNPDKDDFEFVTKFSCLFGHPVYNHVFKVEEKADSIEKYLKYPHLKSSTYRYSFKPITGSCRIFDFTSRVNLYGPSLNWIARTLS